MCQVRHPRGELRVHPIPTREALVSLYREAGAKYFPPSCGRVKEA